MMAVAYHPSEADLPRDPAEHRCQVVLEAAEAADRAVAGMSDDLLAKNDETGLIINPVRAEHRAEHLDDLERTFPPR
jgi:hypothetical protein